MMLVQFVGSPQHTDTIGHLQRRQFQSSQRQNSAKEHGALRPDSPPAKLAARNEDIALNVSSVAVPTVRSNRNSAPPGHRAHVHAAVSMAHGSHTPPMATVPAAGAPVPTTVVSPTEPPARKVDILSYPTVSPETIVVPILSCIVGFPIFALLVICCLRRRAKIARERDRRRNFDLQANTITLVRFNSHHLNNQRSILLQSRDSLSRGYPSLDLDTVYEERSDTHCSSQLDSPAAHMLLADSPPETDNEHC